MGSHIKGCPHTLLQRAQTVVEQVDTGRARLKEKAVQKILKLNRIPFLKISRAGAINWVEGQSDSFADWKISGWGTRSDALTLIALANEGIRTKQYVKISSSDLSFLEIQERPAQ